MNESFEACIVLEEASYAYGSRKDDVRSYNPRNSSPLEEETFALNQISLRVEVGEVVGLVGPNGAGKSTLLRLLQGILKPVAGSVKVFGLSPWKHAVEVKRQIGYVAQGKMLPDNFTIDKAFQLHRQLYPDWDDSRALALAERFGLLDKVHSSQHLASLSPGVLQTLVFICATARSPKLLLLDEPTNGLDPSARRICFQVCTELAARGTTVVLSSHLASDVERIANRVVLLKQSILLDNDLASLLENCCIAQFPKKVDMADLRELAPFVIQPGKAEGPEAVFLSSSSELARRIKEKLGLVDIPCKPLPLDDLLVRACRGECK